MHPPLAKQMMALSIRTFGDMPLGWRYPSVLFGALAIVAMYLCGLALFAAQGRRSRPRLLDFLNQMVFVQSRIAMLDIYALTFGLLGSRRSCYGYRQATAASLVALAGLAFGLSVACKWSGLFPLAVCIAIVAVIRLMQGWRSAVRRRQRRGLVPARSLARIPILSFRRLLRAGAGGRLSRRPTSRCMDCRSPESRSAAQDFHRQIRLDRRIPI